MPWNAPHASIITTNSSAHMPLYTIPIGLYQTPSPTSAFEGVSYSLSEEISRAGDGVANQVLDGVADCFAAGVSVSTAVLDFVEVLVDC